MVAEELNVARSVVRALRNEQKDMAMYILYNYN